MSSIALGRSDVVVGVDTHKDEHVAVALDGLGGRLGELSIPATPDGYAQLLAWADQLGAVAVFGVEGTGSYGSGLARFLRRHGHRGQPPTPQRRAPPLGQERRDRRRARRPGSARRPSDGDPQARGRASSKRSAWSRSPATPP